MHHVLLWCVCLRVGVCTVFLGWLGQTGWCPMTFVSIIETGCFHQPMTHQVGFNCPPHVETFKLVSPRPHTTTFCCTKNQKYHIQQCNNATLCLSKVGAQPPFPFEERRELYLYLCLSVWCCHASSSFDFGFFFFFCCCWGVSWEGGWSEDCHITPVFWLRA